MATVEALAAAQFGADEPGDYDLNDPRYVAIHEAGHAVAAIVLRLPLSAVDIERRALPDGTISQGFTACPVLCRDILGKGEQGALPDMIMTMAGDCAEIIVNPRAQFTTAAADDIDTANSIAKVAICERTQMEDGRWCITAEEIQRNQPRLAALFRTAMGETQRLVEEHWSAIVKVAEQLLERARLDGAEVTAIVNDNMKTMEYLIGDIEA